MMTADWDATSIDLYASEVFSHGGIQTYMRSLIRALSEASVLGSVVSLQDQSGVSEGREWADEFGFQFQGADGSKRRFVFQSLVASLRSSYGVVGYATLAPVAYLQKKLGLLRDYIVILHGIEAWERLRPWEEWALREAGAVVCTTQFTAEKTVELHGVDPADVEILPLAVEPDRFERDEVSAWNAGSSNRGLSLLTVSRLNSEHAYKGVDDTLKAIASLQERGEESGDLNYRIVGDGDDRARLEQLAESLGIENHVEFLGYVSDERLEEAFRHADVFVMPSSGEGFGLVYVEAMCYGLPCIASPEGGAQYVVRDGETGLMAEAGDPESIAEAVEQCFDPSFRERLSARALQEAKSRFAYERFERDFLQILGRRFSRNAFSDVSIG